VNPFQPQPNHGYKTGYERERDEKKIIANHHRDFLTPGESEDYVKKKSQVRFASFVSNGVFIYSVFNLFRFIREKSEAGRKKYRATFMQLFALQLLAIGAEVVIQSPLLEQEKTLKRKYLTHLTDGQVDYLLNQWDPNFVHHQFNMNQQQMAQ